MKSLRRDLACSAILLIIAASYYFAASRIGLTALADEVGPAGLPRIYGVALALIALAIGFASWIRHRQSTDTAPVTDGPPTTRRLLRGAGAVGIGIVCLAVVAYLGYLVGMALTIAAMAVYQGERPSLRVAGISAAGAIILFVLFDVVLGVTLPTLWRG